MLGGGDWGTGGHQGCWVGRTRGLGDARVVGSGGLGDWGTPGLLGGGDWGTPGLLGGGDWG